MCCVLYVWIGLDAIVSWQLGFLWLREWVVCLWCFFGVSLWLAVRGGFCWFYLGLSLVVVSVTFGLFG